MNQQAMFNRMMYWRKRGCHKHAAQWEALLNQRSRAVQVIDTNMVPVTDKVQRNHINNGGR